MKTRKYSPLVIKVVGDVFAILASWLLAGFLRFYVMPEGRIASFGLFVQLSGIVLATYIFFLSRNNLYEEELEHSWRKETSKILKSIVHAFLLLVIMLYFLFSDKVSRIAIAMHFVFAIIFLVTERTCVSSYIKKAYRKGKYTRRILLVGFGEKLDEYEKALHSKRTQGIIIVGQYDSNGKQMAECSQLSHASLALAVEATNPDLVVIGYPGQEFEKQEAMVAQGLDLLNEKVVLLPSLPESYIGTQISDFRWIPMLHLNAADMGFFQRVIKRLFDIVASTIGLILLSPASVCR